MGHPANARGCDSVKKRESRLLILLKIALSLASLVVVFVEPFRSHFWLSLLGLVVVAVAAGLLLNSLKQRRGHRH